MKENKTITFTPKDTRVIEIIDNIPKDIFEYTLEKYIILGYYVTNHASISENKETMKNI